MSFTVDRKKFAELRREGAEMERSDGKPLLGNERTEVELLTEISEKLSKLLNRPDQKQPITLQAPPVHVNMPEGDKRPRHWKFLLKKDDKGRTTEITAKAIE